jgi:hypothetical protein
VEINEKSVKKVLSRPHPCWNTARAPGIFPKPASPDQQNTYGYRQLMQGKSRQEQFGALWWIAHALVQLDSEAC